jgi:hypothetical protein
LAQSVPITVHSEDEAWHYLAQALAGELPDGFDPSLAFEHWPRLDIYLPDTDVESSMSAAMMGALVEFQKSLYRTH